MRLVTSALKFICLALVSTALTCGCSSSDMENGKTDDTSIKPHRYYRGHRAAFMGDSITQMWNEEENGHPEFFERNN